MQNTAAPVTASVSGIAALTAFLVHFAPLFQSLASLVAIVAGIVSIYHVLKKKQ